MPLARSQLAHGAPEALVRSLALLARRHRPRRAPRVADDRAPNIDHPVGQSADITRYVGVLGAVAGWQCLAHQGVSVRYIGRRCRGGGRYGAVGVKRRVLHRSESLSRSDVGDVVSFGRGHVITLGGAVVPSRSLCALRLRPWILMASNWPHAAADARGRITGAGRTTGSANPRHVAARPVFSAGARIGDFGSSAVACVPAGMLIAIASSWVNRFQATDAHRPSADRLRAARHAARVDTGILAVGRRIRSRPDAKELPRQRPGGCTHRVRVL